MVDRTEILRLVPMPPQPREGDQRVEFDYANDRQILGRFINGRWEVERILGRAGDLNRYVAFNDVAMVYTTTRAEPTPEATARANALLVSHLDPQQKEQFQARGWFEVIGGATKNTYRVDRTSWPGKNVTWYRDGKPHVSYCAYPGPYASLPVGDVLLAQKLALESVEGEPYFTRIACNQYHGDYYPDQMLHMHAHLLQVEATNARVRAQQILAQRPEPTPEPIVAHAPEDDGGFLQPILTFASMIAGAILLVLILK